MTIKQFQFNLSIAEDIGLRANQLSQNMNGKVVEQDKAQFKEFLERSEGFTQKELMKYHDKLED